MKVLLFVLLLIGLSSILVGGILIEPIKMNSIDIGVLDDTSELTITECTCEDPITGNYSSEFCDPVVFEPGSYCYNLGDQGPPTPP